MFSNFAILDLSTPDLMIILGIIVLLFGAKKLPELSRSLGQSANELRSGLNDFSRSNDELRSTVNGALNNDNESSNPQV